MALSKTKQQLLFYNLFEQAVAGMFLANAKLEVYDVDASFKKLLKFNVSKNEKIHFAKLFNSPKDFEAFQSDIQRKKRLQNYEVILKSKSGKQIHAELNILKNKESNGEITFMGAFFDISKRKKTERDLMLVEKRLAAGKLSRILAHEVRNPLTNVQLALEQLKDEFQEKAEEADLYFDVIKRNSQRIGNIITALLNSSRPRTAALNATHINELIQDAYGLIQDRATLRNIKVELNYQKELPVIQLDREQLKIAFTNIMVNAIEAMPTENGLLKIETKLQKKYVVVGISDNGIGMNKEEVNQLFEPFFSKKRNGTGLGLTTVQSIVDAHNGSISIKSEPKRGTRFMIKLPI